MANSSQAQQLGNLVQALKQIETNKDKLFRLSLGEVSLKEFEPVLKKIIDKANSAFKYVENVGDISSFNSILTQIIDTINAQLSRNDVDFVSQRQSFLSNIENLLEQLKQYWSPFVVAAIEARGFLDDEEIREEYKKAVANMKTEADATLAQVHEQANAVIEETKKYAEQIETKARQTAARISVKDVQDQFETAAIRFKNNVRMWAALSIVVMLAFFIVAVVFERHPVAITDNVAVSIYTVAVRISILTAIGALATFCLKILRAQMHMREQNLHRQRVANSMPAFVESASTSEQRDIILSRLIDSVSDFGNSGLLSNSDDNISPTKLTIDSIAKNVSIPVSH